MLALSTQLAAAVLAAVIGPLSPSGQSDPMLEVSAPAAFSPDGDGVKDEAAVSVRVDRTSNLSVDVLSGDGGVVATLLADASVQAGETRLRWDGATDTGARSSDGEYEVVARATDAAGAADEARAPIRIDTRAPVIVWSSVSERPGRGPLRVGFRAPDPGGTVLVELLLSDRFGAAWKSGARQVASGAAGASFPLRARGGEKLGPGAYRVALRVTDEAGNARTAPARPILVSFPVATRVFRRLDGVGRRVALTFDDCNEGDAWNRILDVLEAHRLKASFFCLGTEVAEHPAQVRRTLREGHTIGNHTWNHRYLPALSFVDVRGQLTRADAPWWALARAAPMPYFRPPYGALDATALAAIGAAGYRRTVLWDVDPQDWRRPGPSVIAARAVGPARAGSIVLLHVIAQTATALPAIVNGLEAKGLRPVSLDELFRAAGAR